MATGTPRAAGAEQPANGGGEHEPVPVTASGTTETAAPEGFELLVEREPPGLVRRFFTTHRHFLGLLFGGLAGHLPVSLVLFLFGLILALRRQS